MRNDESLGMIQDVELEERVLATALTASKPIECSLTPEHFFSGVNGQIWRGMQSLWQEGHQKISTFALTESLPAGTDWVESISRLMSRSYPVHGAIPEATGKIINLHHVRRLLGVLAETRHAALEGQKFSSLMEDLESGLGGLNAQARGDRHDWLVKAGRAVPDWLTVKTGSDSDFISTDLLTFDRLIGRLKPGTLNIIAGRTAMGKTSFSLFLAHQFAKANNRVVYFSLEMGQEALDEKLLALRSGVPTDRVSRHELSVPERERLNAEAAVLSEFELYYDCNPRATLKSIKSTLRRLLATAGDVDVVFIDYIQMMCKSEENRATGLEVLVDELRAIAKDFGVVMIGLAQISRGVEQRSNKRPLMADLRGSGGIEQSADTVTLLYREEYYDPDTADRGITELILAKNRYGAAGTVKVCHDLKTNLYMDLVSHGF